MVRACSLVRSTRIRLLIKSAMTRLPPLIASFIIKLHIATPSLSQTGSLERKGTCFWWMQKLPRHARLWLLQRLPCLFCGEGSCPVWNITSLCSWQIDLIESLTSFWDYWILPHCFDIFSGSGIAAPVQAADSIYTIVALTTKLFHLLGFLDNLQRPLGDGLLVKEFNGCSFPFPLPFAVLKEGMAFSKINSKEFWFFIPCFFLVHFLFF